MVKSNKKPVLVVLAAGLGSRFKGLKQIQSVDDDGHILIDYSIYDAIEAGFSEIVFIIRKDFEDKFKEVIGNRISEKIKVTYVFQSLDIHPGDFPIPEGREKPWGTTHALWSAREVLKGKSFLTINADDFYGRKAYTAAAEFLNSVDDDSKHACICYNLHKTLSKSGSVNRGICYPDAEGTLVKIDEVRGIPYDNEFPEGTLASMNLWAFSPGFIEDLTTSFERRFIEGVEKSPLKFEETITDAVQDMVSRNAGSVKCVSTSETWFGMTYIEDLAEVKERLEQLREEGIYVKEKW